MKVLVTGGAGYIGAHTVQELLNYGHQVAVLDTLELGNKRLVPANVTLHQGSIGDAAFLDKVFVEEKPDAIINFAAYKAPGESMQQPTKYFENNVAGLYTLLDAMDRHQIRLIVFSSSCAIFGTPKQLPVSEDAPRGPESVYGETKLMGETLLKWYDKTRGIKFSALRYFNASGASLNASIGEDWDHTQNLIPLVMKAALGKSPSITVFGTDYPTRDGSAIRDYIHVVDLSIAHVKALEQIASTNQSTAYNLGTGTGSSVIEVVELAKKISGIDFKVEYGPRRPGDPEAIWADCTRAESELGWKAQYGLDTIVRTAWQWHSTHPNGFEDEK
ncbi:UDP-glucose 4-epimerase GalE [Tengunoibacter tsumagoiensis]|uniref:UDP-glucose 4-epimerase n=1 Tax=Tengunoibacter tsumagoiensis TaxID=2014871 RepID=A0A402A3X5_9CHLR|nr:UDP-glucose 4-epimerase GalE [Tengunoibacter tsumagoiensis]GCE13759.1 UDP-glucose 4-epimerase GalE [Tengunoibacter tsumagoiensis]